MIDHHCQSQQHRKTYKVEQTIDADNGPPSTRPYMYGR